MVSPQDKEPEKLTGIVGCLTLTSAAVDVAATTKDQRATLYCQTKECPKPIALCTLSANGVHQFQLQHQFSVADDEPTFSVKGNLDIHLTGHFLPSDDAEYDSDELLGEEESEEDELSEEEEICPDLVEIQPEPVAEPPMINASAKEETLTDKKQPVTKKDHDVAEPTSTKKRHKEKSSVDPSAAKKRAKASPVNDEDKQAMPVPKKAQTIKKVKGVSIEDVLIGKGAIAKNGKNVKMLYQGFLMNGTKFDECQSRKKPFKFRLGIGECIKGFDIGVEGMRVGGKRRIVIPAKLGYGQRGAPPTIPGNAALRFEIELVGA